MSHGSGLYMMAHVMRRGVNVVPESGGFEPRGDFRPVSRLAAHLDVRRAHHGQAAGRVSRPIARAENIRTIVWGGAPMYVEDALQGARPLRPAARADLRPGRKPDDHHACCRKADIADRDHPRWRERLASAGRPFRCIEVMVADERRPAAAGGRGRRNPLPRRYRDGRLLAERGGERGRADGRLPAHRRRRRVRCRRLSDAEGPLQGPDHLRRLQHLSARGRGGAAAARPACARSR